MLKQKTTANNSNNYYFHFIHVVQEQIHMCMCQNVLLIWLKCPAMAECPQKRPKLDPCIICGKNSGPLDQLVKPRDLESWKTLCDAAEIRHFDPITKLTRDNLSAVPNVLYHRECKSGFTHKKELTRLQNVVKRPELVRTEG